MRDSRVLPNAVMQPAVNQYKASTVTTTVRNCNEQA